MADNVNDHVKTNDASAQQPIGHADVQTGATNAMVRDSMTSAPGASGSLDAGHQHAYSPDAATGATDAFHAEMQKGMIGVLNEAWNKPLNADLAHAKPDPEVADQSRQEKATLAAYGISDMDKGHGENASAIAEQKRVEANSASLAFNSLFDNVGSGKSQSNMRSNNDGKAMFANSNPHLQFSGHQPLSFA